MIHGVDVHVVVVGRGHAGMVALANVREPLSVSRQPPRLPHQRGAGYNKAPDYGKRHHQVAQVDPGRPARQVKALPNKPHVGHCRHQKKKMMRKAMGRG